MAKPSANRAKNSHMNENLPDPILIGRFPWDEPDSPFWSRESMYDYLVQIFKEWGVTRVEIARHLVEGLADACFSLMAARRAIKNDWQDPMVGKLPAYTLQKTSLGMIIAIYKNLGLYPLKTNIERPNNLKQNNSQEISTPEDHERDILLN